MSAEIVNHRLLYDFSKIFFSALKEEEMIFVDNYPSAFILSVAFIYGQRLNDELTVVRSGAHKQIDRFLNATVLDSIITFVDEIKNDENMLSDNVFAKALECVVLLYCFNERVLCLHKQHEGAYQKLANDINNIARTDLVCSEDLLRVIPQGVDEEIVHDAIEMIKSDQGDFFYNANGQKFFVNKVLREFAEGIISDIFSETVQQCFENE